MNNNLLGVRFVYQDEPERADQDTELFNKVVNGNKLTLKVLYKNATIEIQIHYKLGIVSNWDLIVKVSNGFIRRYYICYLHNKSCYYFVYQSSYKLKKDKGIE